MTGRSIFIVLGWLSTLSCVTSPKGASEEEALWPADRVRVEEKPMEKELVAADVMIEKELLYDQFTANLSLLSDAVLFEPLIFVDRTHQNITTLENRDKLSWLVRSMHSAITVSIAHLMPKRLLWASMCFKRRRRGGSILSMARKRQEALHPMPAVL